MTVGDFVKAWADIEESSVVGSPERYSDVERLLTQYVAENGKETTGDYYDAISDAIEALEALR